MCGVVGYIGERQAMPILLEGLKRLEYRGYDSAGLGFVQRKQLKTYRKKGKIVALESVLPEQLNSKIGIGHTRWATHGKVTESNAHPHLSSNGRVMVVHNGIIDNYIQLKQALVKEGYHFASETDSEVIANLIDKYFEKDLESAVKQAISRLQGTYGLIVMSAEQPDLLVGVRNGSPLIVGIGEKETFLASDANAIIAHTKQVIYVEDRETVLIKKDFYKTTNMENLVVDKKIEKIEWDLKDSTKGKFKHYMLKEIFEQPDSIRRAFGEGGRLMPDFGTTKLGGLNIEKQEYFDIDKISIFGMGTAFYAGMTGAYLLENLTRIPTTIDQASELRYRNPIVQKNTLYLAVSQSGETIDTLAAMREIQNRGGKVLGICNTVGSTIARESDGGVYVHAGPEIAVASTKAFTSQITVLLMIALMIGRMRDIPISKGKEILKELESIPASIKAILDKPDQIQKLARKYKSYQHFLCLGRGINYPIALEGALKLKEVSYIHAEGFSAGDIKHGPIALINKDVPTLFIAVKGETFEKTIGNIEEIKARNGKVIVITNSKDERLKKLADDLILIPETSEYFSPLLTVVPLQLLTYYLAKALKRDIDQPRNLAKTVTVE